VTIFLSHFISHLTPGFGGRTVFQAQVASAISQGKSSNSASWTLNNHCGTHVDVPYHFSDSGKKLNEFAAEDWVFKRPHLVDYRASDHELIEPSTWIESVPVDTDLLLIRTNFEIYRASERYWSSNPGLSLDVARWLRTHRPTVRAVGFDFISLTAFTRREQGRAAHREFLCPNAGAAILLIEDLSLKSCPHNLKKVVIAPLLIEGADGAPVTVFAE